MAKIATEPTLWKQMLPTIVGAVLGGLISVSLAVALFRAGRKKDAEIQEKLERKTTLNRKKELKSSWYVNVLISPNLSRIELFFKDLSASVTASAQRLEKAKTGTVKKYQDLQATEIANFKHNLLEFDLEIVGLIQTNTPEISQELQDWVLEVEDIVTNSFDKIFTSPKVDLDNLKRNISEKKTEFYKIISGPIQSRS